MNLFLTIFGFALVIIIAVMGIIGQIGVLPTIALAATGFVGPVLAHVNKKMDDD